MADPTPPPGGDLAPLIKQISDLQRAVHDLKSASGTQRYQSVPKLEALINDIQAQLDAWNQGRRTDAQTDAVIDQKVAAYVAAILAGNVAIGGQLTVHGAAVFHGARATSLASAPNRVAAWLAGPGDARLGHTS